jgi:hypothetical protein
MLMSTIIRCNANSKTPKRKGHSDMPESLKITYKYNGILEQWLKERGWDDEIEFDLEKQQFQISTSIGLSDFTFRLYVEVDEARDLFDVYLYTLFEVKKSRRRGCYAVLNDINAGIGQGRFVVTDRGAIQYNHRIDVEGAAPTHITIERMVAPALAFCQIWVPALYAAATSKQEADEIIDNAREDHEAKELDVTDKIPIEGGMSDG